MSAAAPGPIGHWGSLTDPTHDRWARDPEPEKVLEYHDAQEPFLGADKRYYNFTSGIGAGKTVAGIIRSVLNVLEWNPGETGMILAPTVPALKNVILPEMSKWNIFSEWEYHGPRSEEPGLHAPNGSRILLESANNDRKIERLRGPSIAWFWIDEAALVPRKAWNILTGRLRTGDYRNGFITTTPKGYNWVFDRFVDVEGELREHEAGQLLEGPDSLSVLRVPTQANPYTPQDYKEEVVEEYEGTFYEQEVLGEFTKFEGLVYPWFNRQAHVIEDIDANLNQVFYGVDWGHANPSVILACAETDTGQFVVLEEFYETRVTVNDLVRQAKAMQERYDRGPFFCDPSEPASIETLKRAGIDAIDADNSVLPGIQHVSSIRDRLQVRDICQNLINEFGMYRYPEETDDEQPLKQNDHAMDALRYALFTFAQRGGRSMQMTGADWGL